MVVREIMARSSRALRRICDLPPSGDSPPRDTFLFPMPLPAPLSRIWCGIDGSALRRRTGPGGWVISPAASVEKSTAGKDASPRRYSRPVAVRLVLLIVLVMVPSVMTPQPAPDAAAGLRAAV